eukprot:1587877-Rhodomonas_salina.1
MRGFGCLALALCVTAAAAFVCVPALRGFADSISSAEEAVLKPKENSTSPKFIDVSLSKPRKKVAAAGNDNDVSLSNPTGKNKDAGEEIMVYFGAGCFWHVQHELIEAEKKHLRRTEREATSLTGYAGGSKTGPGGKVCYHNAAQDSDYGTMGHSEAVSVRIPPGRFPEFAKEFFDLFVEGERADPQDVGGEYRSILGIPGGVQGSLFVIAKVATPSCHGALTCLAEPSTSRCD